MFCGGGGALCSCANLLLLIVLIWASTDASCLQQRLPCCLPDSHSFCVYYFEFYCRNSSPFSPIYSFVHLVIYICRDSWLLTLWAVIHHYHSVAQMIPELASGGLCVQGPLSFRRVPVIRRALSYALQDTPGSPRTAPAPALESTLTPRRRARVHREVGFTVLTVSGR